MSNAKTQAKITIPVELFGKDHWSLLGYIETCCVDKKGEMDHDRLRVNPDHNPDLGCTRNRFEAMEWKDEYSTRLKTFPWKSQDEKKQAKHRVSGHDDWDCIEDYYHGQ